MNRRRSTYDPLEPTKDARWLEVCDRLGRRLDVRALPAGTDLKRVFVMALLEHIDAGWIIGEFGSRLGTFFCDKAGERRMVHITPTEPGKHPEYGAAHLVSSPGKGD